VTTDTWNFDDLPADVQQKLDNAKLGEWVEFYLEEDGHYRQYRLRLTGERKISEEDFERLIA
jgi:hypothetical protein